MGRFSPAIIAPIKALPQGLCNCPRINHVQENKIAGHRTIFFNVTRNSLFRFSYWFQLVVEYIFSFDNTNLPCGQEKSIDLDG